MLRVLIISPHRDDAAFSCAISIRSLRCHVDIYFANYFTVSEYAPFRTSEQGSITSIRKQEDAAFAALAGVRFEDLELLDAPQRLSIGLSGVSSTRSFDARDESVVEVIQDHVVQSAPDLLLAPLALGDHIDHRIAQAAAIRSKVAPIAFYEDLPYVARLSASAPEQRASQLGSGISARIISADGGEDWKRRCAAVYPSQVNKEMVEEIAQYSAGFGGGERLWLLPEAGGVLDAALGPQC